jgi:hypothetical protein
MNEWLPVKSGLDLGLLRTSIPETDPRELHVHFLAVAHQQGVGTQRNNFSDQSGRRLEMRRTHEQV